MITKEVKYITLGQVGGEQSRDLEPRHRNGQYKVSLIQVFSFYFTFLFQTKPLIHFPSLSLGFHIPCPHDLHFPWTGFQCKLAFCANLFFVFPCSVVTFRLYPAARAALNTDTTLSLDFIIIYEVQKKPDNLRIFLLVSPSIDLLTNLLRSLHRRTTSTCSCVWPSLFSTVRMWQNSSSPPTKCCSTSATSPCTWMENWCYARYHSECSEMRPFHLVTLQVRGYPLTLKY